MPGSAFVLLKLVDDGVPSAPCSMLVKRVVFRPIALKEASQRNGRCATLCRLFGTRPDLLLPGNTFSSAVMAVHPAGCGSCNPCMTVLAILVVCCEFHRVERVVKRSFLLSIIITFPVSFCIPHLAALWLSVPTSYSSRTTQPLLSYFCTARPVKASNQLDQHLSKASSQHLLSPHWPASASHLAEQRTHIHATTMVSTLASLNSTLWEVWGGPLAEKLGIYEPRDRTYGRCDVPFSSMEKRLYEKEDVEVTFHKVMLGNGMDWVWYQVWQDPVAIRRTGRSADMIFV